MGESYRNSGHGLNCFAETRDDEIPLIAFEGPAVYSGAVIPPTRSAKVTHEVYCGSRCGVQPVPRVVLLTSLSLICLVGMLLNLRLDGGFGPAVRIGPAEL